MLSRKEAKSWLAGRRAECDATPIHHPNLPDAHTLLAGDCPIKACQDSGLLPRTRIILGGNAEQDLSWWMQQAGPDEEQTP